MACLFDTEPLSEPILTYCQWDFKEQTTVMFWYTYAFWFKEMYKKMF